MFGYLLTDYKKVCIIESDMIFIKGFDKIFNFNCPSMLYFNHKDKNDMYKNQKIKLDKKFLLKKCNTDSFQMVE